MARLFTAGLIEKLVRHVNLSACHLVLHDDYRSDRSQYECLTLSNKDYCLLLSASLVIICHGVIMLVFLLNRMCCSVGGQAGAGLQHLHDP